MRLVTHRLSGQWIAWIALALSSAGRLLAQGVTGAAVQGTVAGADGRHLADATVLITNPTTGERWQSETGPDGRYAVGHLSVGGPYTIVVRAIGYVPASRTDLHLSLGQRLSLDVTLVPAVQHLAEVRVSGVADSRINPGRTGPAMTISDSVIERLPIFGRDFTGLAILSPQVAFSARGFSFGGAHDRLNSIQIDGATVQDLKGAGASREARALPQLPPEAIQEIKVLSAPFDVRYGNFAGGLIQAVAKSGSNDWHGSAYGDFEGQGLNGTNPDGTRGGQNTRNELGLTLGGPIVHDRVAMFLSAGSTSNLESEAPVPRADTTGALDSATGVRWTSLLRLQSILRNTYGVDPGTVAGGRIDDTQRSVFAKATAQLAVNSRLEVSHLYQHVVQTIPFSGYASAGLSSNRERDPDSRNTTQVNWTAALGRRWTNELIAARTATRHRCLTNSSFPTIDVDADAGLIVAGSQEVCRGQDNGQSLLELTDNVERVAGSHHLTFGTHNERSRVYDDVLSVFTSVGRWHFPSLDALERGEPDGYRRDVPGPYAPVGGRPGFSAYQVGGYAQDQWSVTPRLTITTGLRLDVPFLSTPIAENPDVLDAFGVSTAATPSGHALWSPRLGFSYDLSGKGASFVRGGLGLFAGRPPFGWFQEAYAGNGLQTRFLFCTDDAVPAFTITDPQPTECDDGGAPIQIITAFDPSFRYPQNFKLSLGVDQRLPWNVVATADLLYTRGVHQLALRDLNLLPPSGTAAGEAGRRLYGTIDPVTGESHVNLRNPAFEQVIQMANGSGDRAYSLALQLQKRFANGNEIGAAYTYTDARNHGDYQFVSALNNLGVNAVDGTRESPALRTSLYEVPHMLRVHAALDLPFKVRLGVLYFGLSGTPFTYLVDGDANADGLGQFGGQTNDPIYVPRSPDDITLVSLDDPSQPASAEEREGLEQLIQSQRCLRSQRGHVLQRNSCRQSWTSEIDARLSKVVPITRGHSLELSADLFNVLNFLDHDWGLKYQIGGGFDFTRNALLVLRGYDTDRDRGIYSVLPVNRREFQVEGTRWQMQLSAKYSF